jgi:hypothetical protein
VDREVGPQRGHPSELGALGLAVDVDPDDAAGPCGTLAGLGDRARERRHEQLLAASSCAGRGPDEGTAATGRQVVRRLAARAHPQLPTRVAEPEHQLDQTLL